MTRSLPRDFWRLSFADFILRSAYQLGKTPVLPLYAAALGAGEAVIGFVVASSTFTGIVAKPVFGFLSDRWGRRCWLFAALCLFALAPLAYPFVAKPEELLGLRLVHGLATAILGPVTLACVVAMSEQDRAARLGMFGIARGAAYLVAPAAGGLLIGFVDPAQLYLLTGALAAVAAVPLLLLSPTLDRPTAEGPRPPRGFLGAEAGEALRGALAAPALWLAGGLETLIHTATYGARAFLPLHLAQHPEGGILLAGLFFSVQEASHLACRFFGGRAADRHGLRGVIFAGTVILAGGLVAMTSLAGGWTLLAAVILGAGQGLVFPAVAALVGRSASPGMTGSRMGVYGALRNTGKVAGPVLAGFLSAQHGFDGTFRILALALLGCSAVALVTRLRQTRLTGRSSA